MAEKNNRVTLEKALAINLTPAIYGTIAEIGAGQEISHWFFRAGGASGTIAKTMSAYDMTFSDEIYGHCDRYVSCQRLVAMLDHEFNILRERLDESRGATHTFFALADTVRARCYNDNGNECQGWLGIRFQHDFRSTSNDILLHVRLLDDTNAEQADALGILGVNLIDAAFSMRDNLDQFLPALLDNLDRRRIEIDMIRFNGEIFSTQAYDDRICALELVEKGLADAALFGPDGTIHQPSDIFYGKPVLLKRGSFDPVTNLHLDMLKEGGKLFCNDINCAETPYLEVMEMTMKNLLTKEGVIQKEDFLARAEVLQSLGKYVLISNYARFFRLSEYITRHTKKSVGIVLGLQLFEELFQEKWYEGIPGGLLEAFGRMFCNGLKLYVYPHGNRATGETLNARDSRLNDQQKILLNYLIAAEQVRVIEKGDSNYIFTTSYEVRELWQHNDPSWEKLVPIQVLQNKHWKKA
jgi:hypothetical protein